MLLRSWSKFSVPPLVHLNYGRVKLRKADQPEGCEQLHKEGTTIPAYVCICVCIWSITSDVMTTYYLTKLLWFTKSKTEITAKCPLLLTPTYPHLCFLGVHAVDALKFHQLVLWVQFSFKPQPYQPGLCNCSQCPYFLSSCHTRLEYFPYE